VGYHGAIFDVDGVLVDSPHQRAWHETLQLLMETEWRDVRSQSTYSPKRYTPAVYQEVVAGKPRLSGARAALDYFGVPDAERRASEGVRRTQTAAGNRVDRGGQVRGVPDALRFILAVKGLGISVAAASSFNNAGLFLRQIRLDEFAAEQGLHYEFIEFGMTLQDIFDADMTGRDFEQGKPHPMIFLTAAEELDVAPQECFVVEDATSGVQAAKAGNMAALGVARLDDEELLRRAGADLVVTTLDDVDLDALAAGRLEQRFR
jgi:beta-phosphoglucomutase-like phosphatase (HAD superfamily)